MLLLHHNGGIFMWVWKDSDGTVRQFIPRTDSPKRCPVCGQYFNKGEKGCVIVPPMEIRKSNKKLSQNLIVHYDEWVKFCEGVTSDEELSAKFASHRVPRQKPFTPVQKEKINAFSRACFDYGFRKEFEKPYGVKRQRIGYSLFLEYNVFADTIDIDHRGRRGMFDSLYERQIIANIRNKMNEILGNGEHDDYSCAKEMEKITNEVKKTMEAIF
jgi:hypothetical protein